MGSIGFNMYFDGRLKFLNKVTCQIL